MSKRKTNIPSSESRNSKRRKTKRTAPPPVPSPPSSSEDEEEDKRQKPIIKLNELRASVQSPAFIANTKLIGATAPVAFSNATVTNFLFGDETTAKHMTVFGDKGQDMYDDLVVGGCYAVATEPGAVQKHRYPRQCLGFDNLILTGAKTTCTLLTKNASRNLAFVKKGLKWNFVDLLKAQAATTGTKLDVCGLINTVSEFLSKHGQQGYHISIGDNLGLFRL